MSISLSKERPTISLAKKPAGYGNILVNLNWNQNPGSTTKGFFAKLLSSPSSIDLDLACLYELKDGSKGVVQALGHTEGDLHDEPYMELSGDDRTGQNADGETITINGQHWDKFQRILVFAFIYEGAPNWNATDGVVTVNVPGEQPIEVRMTDGRNDRRMCGICLIENVNGDMKVTRAVDYVAGHKELDRLHRWGMKWVGATKD